MRRIAIRRKENEKERIPIDDDGFRRRRALRSLSFLLSQPHPYPPLSSKKTKPFLGIYGATTSRDDFCEDDVNFYFEYMGMLAVDGDYARLDKMKSAGLAAVDLLLLMAAGENDAPKVAEMLRAGADTKVKDVDGKTAEELATNDQVLELLRDPAKAKSF